MLSLSPDTFIMEIYGGIHDFIGGELPGYYDYQGNTVRRMDGTDRTIQNTWAVIAIPLVTPFALSATISYDIVKLIEELK